MTPAVEALRRAGVTFEIHRYEHDPSTDRFGLEAAEVLDLDPRSVFKTLIAAVPDGELVVAIVPVAGRLDLKALARAVGSKRVSMADATQAERATGYVTGGISPFGQSRTLLTVVDRQALELDLVYVSGGRRGLEISLDPDDLVAVVDATVAAIALP